VTNPHFAWLPPEINSALMYAGPGAGPLLAAASAWNTLAGELHSSAESFLAVTQDLAGSSWLGSSATAMMAVAAQYASFLRTAAAQAEQAAGQAASTASAFEAALAAMVQPAMVTANRALVQVLAATNWFGMNAPAIMDIEAAYEQMWALDVAAMSGYHFDASAAVAKLAPWRELLHDIGQTHRYNNAHSHGSVAPLPGVTAGTTDPGSASGQNLGYGNSGSNNVGFGNLGNSNIGFGNTGNFDIGFGLTGDHQIGFGGFNSGSGNIGFGNSGTGNIGFFNSGTGNIGIGNSGSYNTGMLNSGTAGFGVGSGMWNSAPAATGLASPAADVGLLAPGNILTGGLGANLGSGLLSSGTGAASPAMAAPSTSYAAATPAAPAASFDAAPAAAAGGSPPVATSLRAATPAAFYAAGGSDSGPRGVAVRDSVTGGQGSAPTGIPNSGFFKNERATSDVGAKRPTPAE
jgi:PPE-repeat protein